MILQLQIQVSFKVEFLLNVSKPRKKFIMINYKVNNETKQHHNLKITMIIIQFKINRLTEEL